MEVTNWVLAPDSCPDNKMTSRLQLVQIILICLIILDLDFEETTCQDTLFSILLCFLFAPSPDYPGHYPSAMTIAIKILLVFIIGKMTPEYFIEVLKFKLSRFRIWSNVFYVSVSKIMLTSRLPLANYSTAFWWRSVSVLTPFLLILFFCSELMRKER